MGEAIEKVDTIEAGGSVVGNRRVSMRQWVLVLGAALFGVALVACGDSGTTATTGDTVVDGPSTSVEAAQVASIDGTWHRPSGDFISIGCAVGDDPNTTPPPVPLFSTGWCRGALGLPNSFDSTKSVVIADGDFEVSDQQGNTCSGRVVGQTPTGERIQVTVSGMTCAGYPDEDADFEFIATGDGTATFDGVEFELAA